jgi:hypothetical protein
MMMWHCVWWCDPVYDDVTLCMMMWHCVWWCDPVYDDVTLCMMMWHCVWWCDTVYDDVTLCMMMWHCVKLTTCTYYCVRIAYTLYLKFQLKATAAAARACSEQAHRKQASSQKPAHSRSLLIGTSRSLLTGARMLGAGARRFWESQNFTREDFARESSYFTRVCGATREG